MLAKFLGLTVVAGALLLSGPSLRADDGEGGDAGQAARAVRLSYVDGDVQLFQGDQALTDQALANTPLFEGARVETGNNGRAEIQFEDGSVARISPDSAVTLLVLKGVSANAERDAEIQLGSGLAYFELQGDGDSNRLQIRFGDTVVTASGYTVLRINLDKAPGEVAVFSGNAHLEGGAGPTLDLHGGESVALNADDPSGYNLAETIEPDSWDAWNSDRDQELTASSEDRTQATENQPDSNNPAWNDLDANGNWYSVPDQGYVWSPNEASNPDWDPYGNGYWMNTPGYGYTWVSGYPWGYLPYSCGGWNWYSSFGWGWAPGACNPWWGGYGGFVINIVTAPPRYRYPVRPPRPRNPRPVGGGPRPVIPVIHHLPPAHNSVALRSKNSTVMIAGNPVQALRPVAQPRGPYNHAGNPGNTAPGRSVFDGNSPRPIVVTPRPGGVAAPAPRSTYAPAPTAPRNTYTPPPPASTPGGGYYPHPTAPPPPPPRPSGGGSFPHPSAPPPHVSSPPPSHPSGGGGGGGSSRPSGGGGGGGGGGRPSGGSHH